MNKWLQNWARVIVFIFGIILAGLAVVTVLPHLTGSPLYWAWIAAFIIFLIAVLVVLYYDLKGAKQKGKD